MSDGSCPVCGQPTPTAAALCAYCLLRTGSEYEYRTVTVLGQGDHGTVYLAEQVPGRRLVAIKIFRDRTDSDSVLSRLERCREVLDRLENPAAVRIIDIGETDAGHPYAVSDYVSGIPIDRYFSASKPDAARRTRLADAARELIRCAHAAGIVHGGLKPSNVLVVRSGGLPAMRVMDFGLRPGTKAGDLTALAALTGHGRHGQA